MNKQYDPDRLEMMRIANGLRKKLNDARDAGPEGPDVTLTAEEAMIAYRAIYGDLSNGHR